MTYPNGKKTMGRRAIEIKKIEKKSSLQVAFTKRRGGLFRKATELSVLCGVDVAILTKSPAGKLYSFGHPSVEALIDHSAPSLAWQIHREYEARMKYEHTTKMIEAEKRRLGGGLRWEEPYDYEGLQLHELEQLFKLLGDSTGMVEQKLKSCCDPPPSLHQQPSSSSSSTNLMVADNFVMDADEELGLVFSQLSELSSQFGGKAEENLQIYTPPLSFQQLMAEDNFVIAAENLYAHQQDGLGFFN